MWLKGNRAYSSPCRASPRRFLRFNTTGAPLGLSVLPPRFIKPNGFFVAKNAPHPHAALLFTDWSLSEEGQKVLAVGLGKGVAMKGVSAKYKEFQASPIMSSVPNSAIS